MSKGVKKTSKDLQVFTVEAQEAIWELAPRDWVGKRKAAIAGIARELGWKFSRTWNIAHGRARRIDAEEWAALQARIIKAQERADKRREMADEISTQLESLRSARGG